MTGDGPPFAIDATRSVDPTTYSENDRVALSVVVITENEENRIEDCIESVLEACRTVPTFEIVVVDSASSDRTVERVAGYPVTVLRIPEEHTSCGAGRFVGDQVAGGEMVLHVDGDMTLTETWLPAAIEYLDEHEDVVAAEGWLDRSTRTEVKDVDKIGGVMLYDADTLHDIGGFDPYLLGYEDIDVGFQLKTAGYRLVRLPDVSAIHHDEGTIAEPFRRWRQGYYIAPGQTLRKWLRSPQMLVKILRRQRYQFALFVWLFLGGLSLTLSPLFLGWVALSAIGFTVVASKRGVGGAIEFFISKALGAFGLLAGLNRRTESSETFPLEVIEVVQTGATLTGNGKGREQTG